MQTLNDTIDVSGEQVQALIEHVPTAIITLMLLLLTLAMLSTGIRFARDRSRPVVLEHDLRRRVRRRREHGGGLRPSAKRLRKS